MDCVALRLARQIVFTFAATALIPGIGAGTAAAQPYTTKKCPEDTGAILPQGDNRNVDIIVDGGCAADGANGTKDKPALYVFHNINVVSGGSLTFSDVPIDFHVESMLVENNGSLTAGSTTAPIGSAADGRLRIYLWGAPDDPGVTCKTDAMCGIPSGLWASNTTMAMRMIPKPKNAACNRASKYGVTLPGDDCFYQYDIIDDHDRAAATRAYFGHKVLALSYGGTLHLYGKKGAIYDNATDRNPGNTGISWARLSGIGTDDGKQQLTLDLREGQSLNWEQGDHIVVTTTDYLPTHSEEVVVDSVSGNTVTLMSPLEWQHNAKIYSLEGVPADTGPRADPNLTIGRAVDTRAAVALLTRSIQITSEGAMPDTDQTEHDHFPPVQRNFFGGHTIIRQGFDSYQVQGVEFWRLGQGGIIGRYPVHFHMARKTPQPLKAGQPAVTFLKDSSIHESMTRFITVHATQGITLQRNVGYWSIGHGFYLEDATETNNQLYGNIGISIVAAVKHPTLNPREVPGILARPGDGPGGDLMPYRSDWNHPTAFWIMNGWNDFQYNMAAGVTTCGACYWLLPGANSGPSVYETWDNYASQNIDVFNLTTNNTGRAGLTPLQNFVGNSCVAAMTSFQTVGDTTDCLSVIDGPGDGVLQAVTNNKAPKRDSAGADTYYPEITSLRNASLCVGADDPAKSVDCSNGNKDARIANPCAARGADKSHCAVTELDHYTTSFNYAETNFAAIWLRPWWFLVTDSAITDSQYGGLNFVTGGGYTRADAPAGFWSLAYDSVFIGTSQASTDPNGTTSNPYADNAGPFNPDTKLGCDNAGFGNCLSIADEFDMLTKPFAGQRMFSLYDGPSFQQNNAYLDIYPTYLKGCSPSGPNGGQCDRSGWAYGRTLGVPKDSSNVCYLPNAAIAWKQPNGFYYPPAFHSQNLFFRDVNIRHFLIEPIFEPGTFKTKLDDTYKRYCNFNDALFNGFTDIDRATVLNDGIPTANGGDGSLTGLTAAQSLPTKVPEQETISVNEDAFFNAPLETVECASDKHPTVDDGKGAPGTAKTSPYEYLTTAMIADCGIGGIGDNINECVMNGLVHWTHDCGGPFCYGPPLYRQYLTDNELMQKPLPAPSVRMMGQGSGQRSALTLNHGHYYVDTTADCKAQGGCIPPDPKKLRAPHSVSVFLAGHTYYTYFVYGRGSTQQTYDIYIGTNATSDWKVTPVRAILNDNNYIFRPSDGAAWIGTPQYIKSQGIVRVTVDLTRSSIDTEFTADFNDLCQPKSYCMVKTSKDGKTKSCGCATGSNCKDDQVCTWGTKDPDCPDKGCYGFGFTMPSNWASVDTALPPPPATPFTDNPYFEAGNVEFQRVSEGKAGTQCYYDVVPTQ